MNAPRARALRRRIRPLRSVRAADGAANLDRRRGFTLIEIILVLAILVIIGSMAAFAFLDTFERAKTKAAKVQVDVVTTGMKAYYLEYGVYPQAIDLLWNAPTDGTPSGNYRKFLEKPIPLDPWGNEYQFRPAGEKSAAGYDFWSNGPDRQEGTADDIGNWQ